MIKLKDLDIKTLAFIVLIVLLGVALANMLAPFFAVIIVSLIIVQLFYPIYTRLSKIFGKALATFISVVLSIILVVLPISFISLAVISEVGNAVSNVVTVVSKPENIEIYIKDSVQLINSTLDSLGIERQVSIPGSPTELAKSISDAIVSNTSSLPIFTSNVLTATAGVLAELARVSGNVLFFGFLFIITLSYLFSSYTRIPKYIKRISPLDDELDELLISKFSDTTQAVVLGNFVVAILQATVVLLMMLILGVFSPALLWSVMVILSLVPVGSGLVWFPVGIFLIFTGNPVGGIVLIIYSAIAINLVDAVFRPVLMQGKVKLHPLLILFSVLGGLTAFGFLGILYGPLIAVFFTSLMEAYNQRYAGREK